MAPAERVRVVSDALDLDEVLLVEQVDITRRPVPLRSVNPARQCPIPLVRLAPPIV